MTNQPPREFWIDDVPQGEQVEGEYGNVVINTEERYACTWQLHVLEAGPVLEKIKRLEEKIKELEAKLEK